MKTKKERNAIKAEYELSRLYRFIIMKKKFGTCLAVLFSLVIVLACEISSSADEFLTEEAAAYDFFPREVSDIVLVEAVEEIEEETSGFCEEAAGKLEAAGGTQQSVKVTAGGTDLGTFDQITDAFSEQDTYDSLEITLAGDCEAPNGTIIVKEGKTVTLDLCGFILKGVDAPGSDSDRGSGSVITVAGSGSFTLRDSAGGGKITGGFAPKGGGAVHVKEGGAFTMAGGEITGNTANSGGGGVYTDGMFTFAGGSISENSAEGGGGVFVSENGTFLMAGGSIFQNNAGKGGAVFVTDHGTFTMNDGEIKSNYSEHGGIYVTVRGTFLMTGGRITGNMTGEGGGVFTLGAVTMTGGTISGNSAMIIGQGYYGFGGGVDVEPGGSFSMIGGSITGNTSSCGAVYADGPVTLGGTAVISGNISADGMADNLYLPHGKTIILSSEKAPESGMSVGVRAASAPTCDSPVCLTGAVSQDYSSHFTSDNAEYSVVTNGSGESRFLQLILPETLVLSGLSAEDLTYGDTLSESGISGSAANMVGNPVPGTFAWKDESTAPSVSDSGVTGFAAVFTPADPDRYKPVEKELTLTIHPKDISNGKVSLGSGELEFTGKEQRITVKSVTVDGLTVDTYTLSGDTSAKGTGTYTVTVTGSGNFTGSVNAIWKIVRARDDDNDDNGGSEPLFTGTWNNAVKSGSWSQDSNGIWHYTSTEKFRNTWGYILNPYAHDGQNTADWFWFDSHGNMLTGWQYINGKWYYLNPNKDGTLGACLIGPAITPDGYEVDASGAWTGR